MSLDIPTAKVGGKSVAGMQAGKQGRDLLPNGIIASYVQNMGFVIQGTNYFRFCRLTRILLKDRARHCDLDIPHKGRGRQ